MSDMLITGGRVLQGHEFHASDLALQDGVIGPKTLAAVAGDVPTDVVAELTSDEESFYATLATANIFLRGWNRRAEDCRTFANQLVKGNAP